MLRPDGHIERNRQTGLRHGPHVRRAGTFARPARTRTGQRADASAGAAADYELHLQGGQTALRRVQLPGVLHRLPHRPPVSPRSGRQPAGVCERGEPRLPEAQPRIQDGRLRRDERRGVSLRAAAPGPQGRPDSGDRHPRGDQGFLHERPLRFGSRTGTLSGEHHRRNCWARS
jgi:hypothetical protein